MVEDGEFVGIVVREGQRLMKLVTNAAKKLNPTGYSGNIRADAASQDNVRNLPKEQVSALRVKKALIRNGEDSES